VPTLRAWFWIPRVFGKARAAQLKRGGVTAGALWPKSLGGMGVWGHWPQRVEGGALAFLLCPAAARDGMLSRSETII